MEAIDTLYFGTVEDFSDDILDEYDTLPDLHRFMSVLAPYSDVVELLKEFILCDFKVAKIDLKAPEFEGEMDYYIDLMDGELWVYPAKDEDGDYCPNDAYIGYIHGDANFKAIQAYCDAWSVREYAIEEQVEDERDICKDCSDKYTCLDSDYLCGASNYNVYKQLKSTVKDANNSITAAKNNSSVEIKDDKTDDGMKGFSATKNSDGKYQSYSFYSTDDDYVDDMREFVKRLFGV